MSCFDTYAKIPKTIPEEVAESLRTDTGYGCLPLILRIRAANFWHESLTTLTDAQLMAYCRHTIDWLYPNLKSNNLELYEVLVFEDPSTLQESLTVIYNYQWWLGFAIGPNTCTRDIAYINELLDLPTNEEWSYTLEETLLKFQTENKHVELVTGYGCLETVKRLRLLERSDFV